MPDAFDPLSPFRLDGRVVILTGASSGLGARFARVLDALGATTILAARRLDRLTDLAASLQRAVAVACDVGVSGANEALVTQVMATHGRLDAVVANAGISNPVPAVKEDPEAFRHVVDIDLVAPYALARAAVPAIRAGGNGGSIVMVSSAAAFVSTAFLPQAGYVAAKAGLAGLTRELSLQWSRYNIRVNALCPGMFPSEMTTDVVENPAVRDAFEGAIPLRRLGDTHELDGALAFLVSGASTYMTGQTLVVDGGLATQ
jgi:NAD(P)-dependent dehydrogenase (short-subunit alcohol dehydrogenase family)